MTISIDFETRSKLKLPMVGAHRYVAHPSTDVWCMALASDSSEPTLWAPGDEPFQVPDDELRAWNADFERLVWRHILVPRYGFDPLPDDQWVCTAAEAAAMALPRGLDQCARVLGVTEEKDAEGHKLMMKMSAPRRKGGWWDDPEMVERLTAYCVQDVRTERAVAKCLRRLIPAERATFLLDLKINDRGWAVDTELVRACRTYVDVGLARTNQDIKDLSGGFVGGATKVRDIKAWVASQGTHLENLTKDSVASLLAGDLPSPVRAMLEMRASAGRTSLGKLPRLMDWVGEDDRARGLFLYHGANTGRWSGKGVQPHNLQKPEFDVDQLEALVPYILDGVDYDLLDVMAPGGVLPAIASLMRGMFVAPDDADLYVSDFAQIEARVLAWLAHQEDLVQMFADGVDVYTETARSRGGSRQMGKVKILGCGFQMGWKRFMEHAATYGIIVDRHEANAEVTEYREMYPRIPEFWRNVDDAVKLAVKEPGMVVQVGLYVRFVMRGNYLYIILPSGRPLCYARPSIVVKHNRVEMVDGTIKEWKSTAVRFYGTDSKTKQFRRQHLYGGLITENIVQAVARDIMRDAMLRVERRGFAVIATVHDEVISEGRGGFDEFNELMQVCPEWAEGCPVAAESWKGKRYRKT